MLAAFGVNHVCRRLGSQINENWSLEGMVKARERLEKFGIKLDQVLCPLTNSFPNILLGKSPERDREVDRFCELIRAVSKAGIPSLQYFFTLVGVPRTGRVPGRGSATHDSFYYEKAQQEPLTAAGLVSEEQYWERITFVLKRPAPVAEECKVKLACHPHDPAMPYGETYRGIHRVLTTPKALQQFLDIVPSKYHCLHFCQGTVAEMIEKPGEQIYDVIRHFGKQGKIVSVHFRNIRGTRGNFIRISVLSSY